jgi:hypothetical protein
MESTISTSVLVASIKELFREAFDGPPDGGPSWFTDLGPGAGLLATLGSIDAATASRVLPGARNSIAGHAGHLRFSFDVFIRALSGEDSYSTADWKQSWSTQTVDEAEWTALRAELRRQSREVLDKISDALDWTNYYIRTGVIGNIAHAAYHLAGIRQLAVGLHGS